MKSVLGFFKKRQDVIIVSGLPRSGTSMMMKMLEAGGLAPLTDGIREPDEDNPRGYYEFERVKRLRQGDHSWLEDAQGRIVKVISALLVHLPPNYNYRVIFMRRVMSEILASQRKMLVRREEDPNRISDERLTDLFRKHLVDAEAWMERHPSNISVLYVSFNEVLEDPEPHLVRIRTFLGKKLDLDRMRQVIEPNLYRQRY